MKKSTCIPTYLLGNENFIDYLIKFNLTRFTNKFSICTHWLLNNDGTITIQPEHRITDEVLKEYPEVSFGDFFDSK